MVEAQHSLSKRRLYKCSWRKHQMRRSLCSLALSGVLAVAGSVAFAQSDNSGQQPPAPSAQPTEGRRGMSPEQQLDRMTKTLQLSTDQQSQIKPILADRQQQMQALYQD